MLKVCGRKTSSNVQAVMWSIAELGLPHERYDVGHRFGGVEFRLGRRELGHIHGDQLVDIPFPKRVRDEIVSAGEAQPHHILPETGWVSLSIDSDEDVERAIRLLRRSFLLAVEHRQRLAKTSN